ncbi:hypothetical protein CCP4SC76_850003 [Gammaproteobacteria bacterium]
MGGIRASFDAGVVEAGGMGGQTGEQGAGQEGE